MRIFCDFDGTISRKDTTDTVLSALGDPAWRALENEWEAGTLSAADCMRRQIALVGGTDADLDAVLDGIEIDPGFVDFIAWARAQEFEVTILSDGVDYFITRLLGRVGLDDLTIVANRLAGEPGARELYQPWARHGCAAASGVCKCEAVRPKPFRRDPVVFIGDGRSDFCVSGRVDILFAKDRLAEYAAGRNRPFHPFETFADVTAALEALVDVSTPKFAAPIYAAPKHASL